MNFKELKELIEIISSRSNIEELEVERAGVRVRIRRSGTGAAPVAPAGLPPVEEEFPNESVTGDLVPTPEAGDTAGLFHVTAPIVGTFYRAPSPDAEPYVNVGDFVEKGSVLCIIEAMKLMNEIESEVAGEVVGIAVESGHPVEYGERLFTIRPR